jgi:putative peptidoglycan lipid II flippase
LGITIKPRLGLEGLGKSFNLAGWTLIYVLISQLGYLVTVNVATSAAVRSAQRVLQLVLATRRTHMPYYVMLLPYSIVTISIITAILPHISKLALDGKREEVKAQLISRNSLSRCNYNSERRCILIIWFFNSPK